MRKVFALLILFAMTAPAHAGNLFPPDNIGGNPNIACPNGSVLRWMGNRVDCVDPTGGVNLTCPTGYVLQGISYGQPICVALPTVATTTTKPTGSTGSCSSSSSTSTSTSTSTSVSGAASASASASATAQATGSTGTSSQASNNTVRHWN